MCCTAVQRQYEDWSPNHLILQVNTPLMSKTNKLIGPSPANLQPTSTAVHWDSSLSIPKLPKPPAVYPGQFCPLNLSVVDTSCTNLHKPTYSTTTLDSLFLHTSHGTVARAPPKKKTAEGVDQPRSNCHGPGKNPSLFTALAMQIHPLKLLFSLG